MLQRRGRGFASRIIIPAGLQVFLGRVEITRSLRTTDARIAARRLSLWESHIQTLFNRLRRSARCMTKEELDELTYRYLDASFDDIEARLALDWTPGGLEEYSFQLNERCHDLAGSLAELDIKDTLPIACELAPEGSSEMEQRMLARRLLEVQLTAAKAELRVLGGEPLRRPRRPVAPAQEAPKAAPRATPRVSEIAAMYAEERVAQGRWSPKTAAQGRSIFHIIAQLLGDPPIGEVTKATIRQLGLDIVKLPANMTKKYLGLSPRQVLEHIGDEDVPRLESRSVNKAYQHARTLFAWALEHDHIAQNPATVLHDVEEGRAQDARKVFDDADIRLLFEHVGKTAREPYGLWVPRIMAYTGCRMGEAAQLRKVDIRQEQGVWVFDFNEESEQKTLKTDGSQRLVPVHPRLLALGLLDFVATCEGDFLFPERIRFTERDTRGNVDRLSKQLNRWLRKAGVIDVRKTFQSFRGTMATRLKGMGVPEYQIAEILGHENDNITTGRYGKRTDLNTLAAAISRLELPI